jgi:hypothetical protein
MNKSNRYNKNARPSPHAGAGNEEILQQLLDEARDLGALADPVVLALFESAVAAPWDEEPILLLNDALQSYRIRQAVLPDPLRPYPGPESALDAGDIEFGRIHETGSPWRLLTSDLPHIGILGPTGGGKSYLLFGLLEQVHGRVPAVLVTVKDTDARLLVDPPIMDRALRFEELKLALFAPPPGIDAQSWQRQTIELLCRVWGLQYSRAILYESCDTLHHLYTRYGNKTGTQATFTPANLHQLVQRKKSKYQEGILAALKMLTEATGDVCEYSQGYPLETLFLQGSALLMIPTLYDERVARFIVDWLMEWLFAYLKRHGPNDGSPQLIFALDDAQRYISRAAEANGLTPLSHRYLIVRQAGTRIIAVSQCPSDLSTVLSQSQIIVQVGGLAYGPDLQAVSAALGLPARDVERLQSPARGEFIARENLGKYARPFGGVVRAFPAPTTGITEAERARLMAPVLAPLPWQPAIALGAVERALSTIATGALPARVPAGPSADAFQLAADVLAHPADSLQDRYNRLGLSGRPGQAGKTELVKNGWVKEHRIPRKRGRPCILLEPLQPLCNALHKPLPSWGKGGFVHAFMIATITRHFQKLGYTGITAEKFYGSKAVDLVATDRSGALIGAEATVSLTNLVDNLEKDFLVQPAFATITVVCVDRARVRQAKRAIAQAPGLKSYHPRIQVERIGVYL